MNNVNFGLNFQLYNEWRNPQFTNSSFGYAARLYTSGSDEQQFTITGTSSGDYSTFILLSIYDNSVSSNGVQFDFDIKCTNSREIKLSVAQESGGISTYGSGSFFTTTSFTTHQLVHNSDNSGNEYAGFTVVDAVVGDVVTITNYSFTAL